MSIGLYITNDIMLNLKYLRYINIILDPDLLDLFLSIVETGTMLKDSVFNIVGISNVELQKLHNKFPFMFIEALGTSTSANLLNTLVSRIDTSEVVLDQW